jgi:hypothetical protein
MAPNRKRKAGKQASRSRAIVGREQFAKISEVEGIRFTDEMKEAMADFDRRKLSHEARRRAIIGRFKRAGE